MKFLRDLFGVKSIRCALGLHAYHRRPWRPEHYGMVCERCNHEEILQFPNGGPQHGRTPYSNPPGPKAETQMKPPPQKPKVSPVGLCADCYAERCSDVGREIEVYSGMPSGGCLHCGRTATHLIPARFAGLACPLEPGSAPGLWFCRRCKKEVREKVCGLDDDAPQEIVQTITVDARSDAAAVGKALGPARAEDGDWWTRMQNLCMKIGARFYGESGTIHRSTVVNVETDSSGNVVALWFRCQPLPFDVTRCDSERADDMRRMYNDGASETVLRGVVVSESGKDSADADSSRENKNSATH